MRKLEDHDFIEPPRPDLWIPTVDPPEASIISTMASANYTIGLLESRVGGSRASGHLVVTEDPLSRTGSCRWSPSAPWQHIKNPGASP